MQWFVMGLVIGWFLVCDWRKTGRELDAWEAKARREAQYIWTPDDEDAAYYAWVQHTQPDYFDEFDGQPRDDWRET